MARGCGAADVALAIACGPEWDRISAELVNRAESGCTRSLQRSGSGRSGCARSGKRLSGVAAAGVAGAPAVAVATRAASGGARNGPGVGLHTDSAERLQRNSSSPRLGPRPRRAVRSDSDSRSPHGVHHGWARPSQLRVARPLSSSSPRLRCALRPWAASASALDDGSLRKREGLAEGLGREGGKGQREQGMGGRACQVAMVTSILT